MRNPDRYTWFGIEKPFPWALLAWPVLWLWSTVREWQKPKAVEHRSTLGYPKKVGDWTLVGFCEDGYPQYLRPIDGPPIPMSEFTLGRRYGPNGWVDQDADLPQAGSAWNWEIKIGDTDYE